VLYEIVFPPDTQNEIETFIVDYFIGQASQIAAVDALEIEVEKVRANPTLGIPPAGTPFQTRRLHRFVIRVGDVAETVEFGYHINPKTLSLVIHEFHRIAPLAL
jgi:hypothetical protein